MTIRLERSTDLASGDEIKQLFLRNERPNFPGNFDLVYPESYASGGSSWLARDDAGKVVGHIAVFPRSFRQADQSWRAVVFGDLMMDAEHRDFFSGARLVRQATGDLKRAAAVDFAFAHSIDMAAGVLRAGGLNPIGTIRRYVRPVHAVYGAVMKLASRAVGLTAERFQEPWHERVMSALEAFPPGSYLCGERTLSSYEPQLGRESLLDWEWILLRERGDPSAHPVAVVLVADHSYGILSIQDLRWDETRVSGESVLHALAEAARKSGHTKLSISALTPSRFATLLKRCGFIIRVDQLALLRLDIRKDNLPTVEDWLLSFIDGTAW